MNIIDFREIDPGNKGGHNQDEFELFSRDFLEAVGFKILLDPSRGPDGKKDMIINGAWETDQKINWLVSCKHNANAKTPKSVNDSDEINITERLRANNCQGFIGIYSTIAATSLMDLLYRQPGLQYIIFDHRKIENLILQDPKRHQLFFRYFTTSYEKYKDHLTTEIFDNMTTQKNDTDKKLTEEDFLRISLTAGIIIEIEKIKERFFAVDWDQKSEIIGELYKYSAHTNLVIANHVFSFLESAAAHTRSGMPENIALSIYTLTINFFPHIENDQIEKIIELSDLIVYMAFAMIYDSFIYTNNYKVAMYGLTTLKYVYRKGKTKKITALTESVDKIYSEIERNLDRPERNDLEDAKELVKIFKADRMDGTLRFPRMPEKFYK